MNVGIKQLNFYKNRIKQQLANIRSDIGELKYELYIKMVDICEDYHELLEMAELEMQIDFLKYTNGNIMDKLEKDNITVRDLKEAIDRDAREALDKPIETDEEYELMANMEDMSEVDDAELDAALLRQLIQREEDMPDEERNRDSDYLPGMEVSARIEEQWENEQIESLFDYDEDDDEYDEYDEDDDDDDEYDEDSILGEDESDEYEEYDEELQEDDDDILGTDNEDESNLDNYDDEDDIMMDDEDDDDILGYDDEDYDENEDDTLDENDAISEEDFFLADEGSEFSDNYGDSDDDDDIDLDDFFSDEDDDDSDEDYDDDYDGVLEEDDFFIDADDEEEDADDSVGEDAIDEDDFFLDEDDLDEDILGDEESDEDIIDNDILGDDNYEDEDDDEDIIDDDILGDDDYEDDDEDEDILDYDDVGEYESTKKQAVGKDTLVDFGGKRKQLFKDTKTQNTFDTIMGLTNKAEAGLRNIGNNKRTK